MKLHVAGLQTAGTPADIQANLAELDAAALAASSRGAELLITPELFITGYDIGDRVKELAQGDLVSPVARIATRHGIAILAGFPELDRDGKLYNSAVFIAPTGDILGCHRKTHLFGELDKKYFAAGANAPTVVDYKGVRIGVMICYDVEFAENVRMAALAGADLVAVPTAQMQPYEFVAESIIRARAWENQIYVAYINHDGVESNTVYVGRSSIVAPDATVLDSLVDGNGLIFAEVDTAVVREAQQLNPYLTDLRPSLDPHRVAESTEDLT